jgi:ankyrin repeat protein
VQLLLDNKADVNVQSATYGTALQAASLDGHKEIMKLLLDNKGDVNVHSTSHGPALEAWSVRGHKEIVQLLINNKIDVIIEELRARGRRFFGLG